MSTIFCIFYGTLAGHFLSVLRDQSGVSRNFRGFVGKRVFRRICAVGVQVRWTIRKYETEKKECCMCSCDPLCSKLGGQNPHSYSRLAVGASSVHFFSSACNHENTWNWKLRFMLSGHVYNGEQVLWMNFFYFEFSKSWLCILCMYCRLENHDKIPCTNAQRPRGD